MLEEMNSIQIFLSLNCDNSKPGIEKYLTQMYGYTITEPVETLNFIKHFDLKSNSCTSPQTFLHRFVGIEPNDPAFTLDIGNSKPYIFNQQGTPTRIKEVFKQIQLQYNMNIIYIGI